MEVRELTDKNHVVLGNEQCSGYRDLEGKWNAPFVCPTTSNNKPVFCCGTPVYKYCCTHRDRPRSTSFQPNVLIAIVLGALAAVLILTVVAFFLCKRCLPYKRALQPALGGPPYRLHSSSTASRMASLYSAGQSSLSSPLEDYVELGAPAAGRGPPLPPYHVHGEPPPPYQECLTSPPIFSSFCHPMGPTFPSPTALVTEDGSQPGHFKRWSTNF